MQSVPGKEGCQLLMETAVDYALIGTDEQSKITDWTSGAERLFGYEAREALGNSSAMLFEPADREAGEPERQSKLALDFGRSEQECWQVRKDGTRFRTTRVVEPQRDGDYRFTGLTIVVRDLTERESVRRRLEESARQCDLVASELNHRIKNNLQVMVSLFNLQANRTEEPALLELLGQMQNRVRVFAHIQEQVYTVDGHPLVHFGEYLKQLANELAGFYGLGERVTVDISVADLALDADDALSLALVSNELLSNAFRYAFPGGRAGAVRVALRYVDCETAERCCELKVEDNGIGLPAQLDFVTADSLGFHIVRILARQLGGTAEVGRERGTSFCLSFPLRGEF